MNIIKRITVLLVGFIVLIGVCIKGEHTYAMTTTSKGMITYSENTGTPGLLDPEDPKSPNGIITVPQKPGTSGPLSIDFVSDFKFEKKMISGNDETYYASLTTIADTNGKNEREVPNYIQVTDNRGTNTGWSLSVKQEKQFTSTISKQELTGAILTLTNLNSDSKSNDGQNAPNLATTQVKDSYQLTPGSSKGLLIASTDEGIGSWVTLFGEKQTSTAKTSVILDVPGKAKKVKEAYETELSWVLSVDPSI